MEVEGERRRFSYTKKTFVYWDIEDFPLPEGYTIHSFYDNVESSLKNHGYGDVRIVAYGDSVKFHGLPTQNQLAMSGLAQIPYILDQILSNFRCGTFFTDRKHSSVHVESLHPNIPLLRLGCRYGRHTNILLSMLSNARMDVLSPRTELNFMLIIKDMPEEDETEAGSSVQFLKSRHYNVLVVVGDEDDECAYPSDVPLWRWKTLLEGGGPVSSVTRSEEDDEGTSRKRYRITDDFEGSSRKDYTIRDDDGLF